MQAMTEIVLIFGHALATAIEALASGKERDEAVMLGIDRAHDERAKLKYAAFNTKRDL
jgi:3-dehydroquinate synthetase